MVFVSTIIMRKQKLHFGTTDTDHTGVTLGASKNLQEDVDYLLGIVNNPLPRRLTSPSMISKVAGLVSVR